MIQFWNAQDIPLPGPYPAERLYPWLWGASPEFSVVLGDPSAPSPTPPGVLSGLGTTPIILATPTLGVQQTDTNTLAFPMHVDWNQYVLSARYALEQSSDLTQPNWTAVTNLIGFSALVPRPSATTFYRLAVQ